MNIASEKYYTVKQAAELLHVSKQTIYNYIWDDKIEASIYKPDKRKSLYRITESEIDRIKKSYPKYKKPTGKVPTHVYLMPSTFGGIKAEAGKKGVRVSKLVNDILDNYLCSEGYK